MLKSTFCVLMSLLLITGSFSAPVSAAVIETADALSMQARDERIADIQRNLSSQEVQQAMITMGVDPEQARARVASLNDAELAQLATQLETLPAGGDALALIGAVFVVLLILELVGVINIFGGA